jgi:hypothetical protein
MAKIIELPAMINRASIDHKSFDEADNSIEVVWTTGASVRRYDRLEAVHYNEVLDVTQTAIRLERLNAGAPFLDTHASYTLENVKGVVIPGTARIENGNGIARVKLSSEAEDVALVGKIKGGLIRNISVGYAIHRVERTSGKSGEDETWRVVDWEPMEISAVAVPADPGAQIRSNAGGSNPTLYRCEVIGGRTSFTPVILSRMLMRAAQYGLRSR